MPEPTSVLGPYPVYVRSTPSGAALDLSDYLDAALRHLADARPEELTELVAATDAASVQTSYGSDDAHAVHERDALAQELADAVPHLLVQATQAAKLAAKLAPAPAVESVEVARLRAELKSRDEVIRRLDKRLAELQRVNEARYREDHDATGGPRLGDGEHAMAWPPKPTTGPAETGPFARMGGAA